MAFHYRKRKYEDKPRTKLSRKEVTEENNSDYPEMLLASVEVQLQEEDLDNNDSPNF
jgi:hypothetical protein